MKIMDAVTDNDFDPADAAPSGDLADIAAAVDEYREAASQVETLTRDLAEANKRLGSIRFTLLPEAMSAARQEKCTVEGGYTVELKRDFTAGQLDDPEALAWLDGEGHGDLTKNMITLRFNREDHEAADEIWAYIRAHRAANSIAAERARNVNAATLKAFCREMQRQGGNPPLELLHVTPIRFCTVKEPKE